MSTLVNNIIGYINENRISTTEVADVLNKTGELDPRLHAITPRSRAVGKLFYVPAFNGSNWYTHYFLQETPENSVVYVEGINCGDKAIFGDLVAKYVLLYKKANGIIVSGNLRDMHQLIKEQYPIWCWGGTPIGCVNKNTGFDEEYYKTKKNALDGSLIVADDSGVIIVRKEQLTQDFFKGLNKIEQQEDIWYDCIDRLKYSTFETVCLKKYETPKE